MTGIRGRRGVRGINRQRTLERRNDEQTGLRQQPKGVRGLLPQGVHGVCREGWAVPTTFCTPGANVRCIRLEEAHSASHGSSSGSRLSCWGEVSVLSDQPELPIARSVRPAPLFRGTARSVWSKLGVQLDRCCRERLFIARIRCIHATCRMPCMPMRCMSMSLLRDS
jgi:hypothetical protein